MSPAKRLSRQRFRALCERCARFGSQRVTRLEAQRMRRFVLSRGRFVDVYRLARLAR